jgi:hypothetical protein
MLVKMPKQAKQDDDAKVIVYSRIDPATVRALDDIRESMKPKPTRAQLIDVACAEYVERHGKSDRRQKTGG